MAQVRTATAAHHLNPLHADPEFAARVDARTDAKVGSTLRLAVDPARLYFFSPETGESLLGRNGAAAV